MTFAEHKRKAAREYLHSLMLQHCGNVIQAAKAAGCNRTQFYRVLKRYGIEPALYR